VEVWVFDGPGRVGGVPGDGQVVELLVVDLDLVDAKVEQDRSIGEPCVVVEVPDQPDVPQGMTGEGGEPGPCAAVIASQPLSHCGW
jgi:hypothetical protein